MNSKSKVLSLVCSNAYPVSVALQHSKNTIFIENNNNKISGARYEEVEKLLQLSTDVLPECGRLHSMGTTEWTATLYAYHRVNGYTLGDLRVEGYTLPVPQSERLHSTVPQSGWLHSTGPQSARLHSSGNKLRKHFSVIQDIHGVNTGIKS